MNTKTKSQKVDCRPGEAVIVAAQPADGQKVVFVANKALRRGPMHQPAYVLEPGVPYILPAYLFAAGADGAGMVRRGEVEIVDQTRGVLPRVEDIGDSNRRAEPRDGVRPGPNRQQVLNHYRQTYGEWSVGECILLLVEAGWTEEDAANVVIPEWKSAFERRDGSVTRQSWCELTQRILANNGAKEEAWASTKM